MPQTSTQVERIQRQLDRVFEGDAWHGTPIMTLLSQIDAATAAAHPIASAHSVWENVDHITAWLSIVRTRVGGTPVHEVPDEMDWPQTDGSGPDDWEAAKNRLRAAYLALRTALNDLSDDDLENRIEGKLRQYSVYEDLHGVMEHSLYHMGQVTYLVKAV